MGEKRTTSRLLIHACWLVRVERVAPGQSASLQGEEILELASKTTRPLAEDYEQYKRDTWSSKSMLQFIRSRKTAHADENAGADAAAAPETCGTSACLLLLLLEICRSRIRTTCLWIQSMPFLSKSSSLAVNAVAIAAGQIEAPSLPLDHKKTLGLKQTSVAACCADAAPLGSSDAAQSRASLLSQPSQNVQLLEVTPCDAANLVENACLAVIASRYLFKDNLDFQGIDILTWVGRLKMQAVEMWRATVWQSTAEWKEAPLQTRSWKNRRRTSTQKQSQRGSAGQIYGGHIPLAA